MKAITLFLGLIASFLLLTSCATHAPQGTQYAVKKESSHTDVTPVEAPKTHHHVDYKGESLGK